VEAQRVQREAEMLEQLGAFSVVLECVPAALATEITEARTIPTIGIGAGVGTSGQVLVLSDLLGLDAQFQPRFARRYLDGHPLVKEAIDEFGRDVRNARFPAREEVIA
jgi:3-methyl-2-oxobutanoate hydroxymethyltransferase